MTSKPTAESTSKTITQKLPTADASNRSEVIDAIIEIAPDLCIADLELTVDLRHDLGLDSIDLLNIAAAISERTGLEIPESDYSRLNTVRDLVEFVEELAG